MFDRDRIVNGGDIAPVLVWHAGLHDHEYDIVTLRTGTVSTMHPQMGWTATGLRCACKLAADPVPALTPAGIIALVGLLDLLSTSV